MDRFAFRFCLVIHEQDPLKQGLKHHWLDLVFVIICNSRARSTKTRIETFLTHDGKKKVGLIHEQDPLKQGLKLHGTQWIGERETAETVFASKIH